MRKGKRLLAVCCCLAMLAGSIVQGGATITNASEGETEGMSEASGKVAGLSFGQSGKTVHTYLQLENPLSQVPKTIEASIKSEPKQTEWVLGNRETLFLDTADGVTEYVTGSDEAPGAGLTCVEAAGKVFFSKNFKLNANLNIDIEGYEKRDLALTFWCYSESGGTLGDGTGIYVRLGNNTSYDNNFLQFTLGTIALKAGWNKISIPLTKAAADWEFTCTTVRCFSFVAFGDGGELPLRRFTDFKLAIRERSESEWILGNKETLFKDAAGGVTEYVTGSDEAPGAGLTCMEVTGKAFTSSNFKFNASLSIDVEGYEKEDLALSFWCYSDSDGTLGNGTGVYARLGNNTNYGSNFLQFTLGTIALETGWNKISIPLTQAAADEKFACTTIQFFSFVAFGDEGELPLRRFTDIKLVLREESEAEGILGNKETLFKDAAGGVTEYVTGSDEAPGAGLTCMEVTGKAFISNNFKLNANLNIDIEGYEKKDLALSFWCYSDSVGTIGNGTGVYARLGNNTNYGSNFLQFTLGTVALKKGWNKISIPLTNAAADIGFACNTVRCFGFAAFGDEGELPLRRFTDFRLERIKVTTETVNGTELSSNNMIFSNVNGKNETNPYAFFITEEGYPSLLAGTKQVTLRQDVRTGEWVDLAAAIGGDNCVSFYVDGKFAGKSVAAIDVPGVPTTAHCIGADGRGRQIMKGSIADIRLWSDERTAEEISENRIAKVAGNLKLNIGNTDGLLHSWFLVGDIQNTAEAMPDTVAGNNAVFCGAGNEAAKIPYEWNVTIEGTGLSTKTAVKEAIFDEIDVSDYDTTRLQLVMDIEITSESGKLPAGIFYGGQIELTSGGKCDSEELSKNVIELNWRYGKHQYAYDLAECAVTGGAIDYAAIDYMRIYFNEWDSNFTDTVNMKVSNVRLVEKEESEWILPTVFSDGMIFQQKKPMNLWGYGKTGETVTAKLYKGETEIETKTATVEESGKWNLAFTAQDGSCDNIYKIDITAGTQHYEIRDILIGELWIAGGQSNMELWVTKDMDSAAITDAADNSYVRFYAEPIYPSGQKTTQPVNPNKDIRGAYWGYGDNPVNVSYTSSLAYTFAKKLQESLKVPVGYINCAVGGSPIEAWLSREAIGADEDVKAALKSRNLYKENATSNAYDMSNLYNQKIGPLEGMNVAGMIWYQGETNGERSEIYDIEFDLLKRTWSQVFGFADGDMPLIFTQVAPYQAATVNQIGYLSMNMEKAWKLSADKNTAMLAIYDLPLDHIKNGKSYNSIHPRTKTPVAERFYQSAMNMVYGGTEEYTAPVYKGMEIKNNAIYITFDRVGSGLTTTDSTSDVHGFTIAGEDGVYVNAKAKIINEKVVKVWNDRVAEPKNVIYAFDNLNQGANLCNSAKIPASPFRTAAVDDTVMNPDGSITYFLAQDWMYADKDVWVKDSSDTTQKSEAGLAMEYVGYKPSFKVDNGTYSYDSRVKEEGSAALKVDYSSSFEVSPILSYDSIIQDWSKFRYLTVSMLNADSVTVSMVIKSGDAEYTIPCTDSAAAVSLAGNDKAFTTVTFDLTKADTDILSALTEVTFKVTADGAGTMYFDNFQFGMTEAVVYEPKITLEELRKVLLGVNKTTDDADVNGDLAVDIRDLVHLKRLQKNRKEGL